MKKNVFAVICILFLIVVMPSCKKQTSASPDAQPINSKMGGIHMWTGAKQILYADSVTAPGVSSAVSVLYKFGIAVINDSVVLGSRTNAYDTLRLFTRNDYTNTLVFKGQSPQLKAVYITFNYRSNGMIYDDYESLNIWSVADLAHCRLYIK